MDLQILCDNNVRTGFKEGWGFSYFVKTSCENILFDIGWNSNILIHNMKVARIKPEEIDKIVISHSDWDYIGDLNSILNYEKQPEVYVPESILINIKNEIKRHAEVIEISKAGKN